jgi:histidine ammonia-lyase
MGLQTTAAALVSECKSLGWCASLDSIPTCEDQEDHVAMSTTAARRAAEVVKHVEWVINIELVVASRALMCRLEEDPSTTLGRGSSAAFALLADARTHLAVPSEAVERVPEMHDPILEAVAAACPDLEMLEDAG